MTEKVTDINKQIMGYGEKLNILVGKDDAGKDLIMEYHFTPVPLKDIPALEVLLDGFFSTTESDEGWTEESIMGCCELIHMSTKKMHPELTVETINEQFTLSGIAKAVKIVMDVNDFLSEMESLKKQSNQMTVMSSMVEAKNKK